MSRGRTSATGSTTTASTTSATTTRRRATMALDDEVDETDAADDPSPSPASMAMPRPLTRPSRVRAHDRRRASARGDRVRSIAAGSPPTATAARPHLPRGDGRRPRRRVRGPGLARSSARRRRRRCSIEPLGCSSGSSASGCSASASRPPVRSTSRSGGYLLVAGAHRGWMDPFVVMHALPVEPRCWILGSGPSTFTTRWREWLVRRIGGLLPVWRGGVGIDPHVASARAVVDAGAVFVQMPEGTVSGPPGRLGAMRTGWAIIALRTDAAGPAAGDGRHGGAVHRPADGVARAATAVGARAGRPGAGRTAARAGHA